MGLILSVLAAAALEITPAHRTAAFVVLSVGASVGAAAAIAVGIFARRDRAGSTRVGGIFLSVGAVYDLSRPLTGVTAADRASVEVSIAQQRRESPGLIIGSLLYSASFTSFLLAAAVGDAGGVLLWFWVVWSLVFAVSTPLATLKVLGTTTAILRRLEAAPEPPTYLGPRGWGIEAPRKATGEDATPG